MKRGINKKVEVITIKRMERRRGAPLSSDVASSLIRLPPVLLQPSSACLSLSCCSHTWAEVFFDLQSWIFTQRYQWASFLSCLLDGESRLHLWRSIFVAWLCCHVVHLWGFLHLCPHKCQSTGSLLIVISKLLQSCWIKQVAAPNILEHFADGVFPAAWCV